VDNIANAANATVAIDPWGASPMTTTRNGREQ
jgi:hypothetical protein